MQGGNYQVSGDCRTHGNFSRFCVTGFTDHDNIRILSQQGTQSHCKGHAGSHINGSLRDIGQVFFHRVLNGRNIYRSLGQMLQYHIQRGRFTGTGRPRNIDDAVGGGHHLHQHVIGILVHAKVTGVVDLGIRHQITHNDLLAVCRRQNGNTHTDVDSLQHSVEVAVLRDTFFRDVQVAHDLDTGNNGVVQCLFQCQIADHLTVDTHTHLCEILKRFNVNIAGVGAVSPHQQRVDQLDDRHIVVRIVCRQLGHLNIFCGNIRLFGCLLGTDLGIVILDRLFDFRTFTEQHFQRHIHDLPNIFLCVEIQRVRHGEL